MIPIYIYSISELCVDGYAGKNRKGLYSQVLHLVTHH